jgi:hypothetical protein
VKVVTGAAQHVPAGMRSRCARPDRVRKTICHIAGRFETWSAGVENGSSGTR